MLTTHRQSRFPISIRRRGGYIDSIHCVCSAPLRFASFSNLFNTDGRVKCASHVFAVFRDGGVSLDTLTNRKTSESGWKSWFTGTTIKTVLRFFNDLLEFPARKAESGNAARRNFQWSYQRKVFFAFCQNFELFKKLYETKIKERQILNIKRSIPSVARLKAHTRTEKASFTESEICPQWRNGYLMLRKMAC